jgi:hypothetical protein
MSLTPNSPDESKETLVDREKVEEVYQTHAVGLQRFGSARIVIEILAVSSGV